HAQLAELVKITGIPVVTTLMARGVFPDSHDLHMGMPGMHGSVSAVGALQRSDLLITLGARFDDRVTGKLSTFAPEAKVIHADIDPAEIGKNRTADVPIVGDLSVVIDELNTLLRGSDLPDWSAWVRYLTGLKAKYTPDLEPIEEGLLSPEYVIKRLGEIVGPDAYYAAGVGQHQMWAAHLLPHERPGHWLNSGGAGTMGYCVPAAMGAQVGQPDAVVWGIDGDGCFQMTNQELVTCALEGIPIKIAVMNNQSLGMVRQWQTLFYGERYSNTDLKSLRVPDFPKLAEAMGAVGLRAEAPEDVDRVINEAMAINDRPVVVEFVVHKDAMVWPMVAAGTSNDDIKIAKDLAPAWEEEEL
ncbi:MAG: acetolactate synthase large subunit, partial [Propionibacteriaceae bacterium]|nr:acetolactate synthase large subunit [Propionibacteriaceae bacterium]